MAETVETTDALIEHACGHLARATLWADPEKRRPQLGRLEAAACRDCLAAGWMPPQPPPKQEQPPPAPPAPQRKR